MHLAGNLKYLRKKSGKTQDALSSELKIGRTTIANYESGISEPNVETLLISPTIMAFRWIAFCQKIWKILLNRAKKIWY